MRKHRASIIARQLRAIRANPWPWRHAHSPLLDPFAHAWSDYVDTHIDPEELNWHARANGQPLDTEE